MPRTWVDLFDADGLPVARVPVDGEPEHVLLFHHDRAPRLFRFERGQYRERGYQAANAAGEDAPHAR